MSAASPRAPSSSRKPHRKDSNACRSSLPRSSHSPTAGCVRQSLRTPPKWRTPSRRQMRESPIVGCGTSLYMAQSCAVLRENAGLGETDAFPAIGVPALAPVRPCRRADAIRDNHRGHPAAGSIAGPGLDSAHNRRRPARRAARGRDVVLDFADEQSVVQTRFATTALALWRAHLGENLDAAIEDARRQLSARPSGPARRVRPVHLSRHRLDRRPGQRGGTEVTGGVPVVDRGLSGDGVPARADKRRGRALGGVDIRPGPGRTGRRHHRQPARSSSNQTSTRWRTWSAPSVWP